jgi:ribosomal protein S18 acetylase RimI-like enzyme
LQDFEIISITEKYIEVFWEVLDSVAREKKFLAFLEAPPMATTKAFVLRQINEDWPHLLAIHKGNIIGWSDITPLDRPIFSHIGTLGMGVLAAYRGQGIGKALLKTVLEKAHTKGLTRIALTVREENTQAINLYEQFGFVIEGLHKNAVKIDGHYEHELSMALLFRQESCKHS